MNKDILIFWHHVGREHGGLTYTKDIRKNSEEVVNHCLFLKEQRWREETNPHRFIRHDATTLVELPPVDSKDKFIIIYQIDEGLQYEFKNHDDPNHYEWIVDIVSIHEIKPDVYCVSDLFIDITIFSDGSYQVLDMDEFKTAVEKEVLSQSQILHALDAFSTIMEQLNNRQFPGNRLLEIKDMYF